MTTLQILFIATQDFGIPGTSHLTSFSSQRLGLYPILMLLPADGVPSSLEATIR
jgi:hypothetical protein